ncbi:MAG: hypothetical protein KJO83_01230, partial [Bacteroidia bacterium]|nr:hypothetical protein [Bacteroidia bacterium]
MESLVGDNIGLIHFLSSLLALICGSLILILKKGTKKHKKMGYTYTFSMVILLTTSFMMYRLFNGFGIFHYAAILSAVTLILGMIPVWIKKPRTKWLIRHFSFMYWSVIGLYAAFVSEILTRIPDSPFFSMVGLATVVILILG